MKLRTALVMLLALPAIGLAPGLAHADDQYRHSSQHPFGNTHNNYHAGGTSYGASTHNYDGKLTYGQPPVDTNHPADSVAARQAWDTSAPY